MLPSFKDWRTTVPGLISAFFAFVGWSALTLHWPTWVILLAGFISAGGLSSLGINARSQGKHDVDAKQMANAVQQDIHQATGVQTYGAMDVAAEQASPSPQQKV